MSFQLCEGLLDGIEIGRVGRQETQFRAGGFDNCPYAGDFVGGKIVHSDNIALYQGWREDLLEVGEEGLAIHRPVDDQGSGNRVVPESRDEGRDFPMAVRDFRNQALPAAAAASEPGHVGAGAGLVDEHQMLGIKLRLAVFPGGASRGHVGAVLLAGVQAFF